MAFFDDLVADVITLTNRPDLQSKIEYFTKQATLKAHKSDFYPKDLKESGITWQTPSFTQSLEYATVFPQWRAFSYLRKYDATGGVAGDFFTHLLPEEVLDGYGVTKTDVCYTAGNQLEIHSSTEDEKMIIGYYANPVVTNNGYDSWIARDYRHLIVAEAARSIFSITGYETQAKLILPEIQDQYTLLRTELYGKGE